MFIEVIEEILRNPNGEELPVVSLGLLLNVDGQNVGVPLKDVSNIYTDAEELVDSKKFYVTYQGAEYEFQVPETGTANWQYLQDVIETE